MGATEHRNSDSDAEAARLTGRAVFIWQVGIIGLAALHLAPASILSAIALPLYPRSCSPWVRLTLFALSALALLDGDVLTFSAPVALLITGSSVVSGRALIALVAVRLTGHHLQTLAAPAFADIHPLSLAFIVLPSLAIIASFGPALGWKALLGLLASTVAVYGLYLGGGELWITPRLLTSPTFQTIGGLIPLLATIVVEPPRTEVGGGRFVYAGAAVGALASILIPVNIPTSIVFDESHGAWETVRAPYRPTDFGRGVNYTYQQLFQYSKVVFGSASYITSEQNTLPERGVFVLKMPTQDISDAFADRLDSWVSSGGSLLVVADHTDLYNHAQILNKFLSRRYGTEIASTATFDRDGNPSLNENSYVSSIFGTVLGNGLTTPWQTGSSFRSLPAHSVSLLTYGPSFAEEADYSSPNRFGQFRPDLRKPFFDHSSLISFSRGSGSVTILLDSTPWSNFSFFLSQYQKLLTVVKHVAGHKAAIAIIGWGSIFLGGLAMLNAFRRIPLALGISGIVMGLTLGAAAQVGSVSWSHSSGLGNAPLRVLPGSKANLRFLRQLVEPGEYNYARLISSLAKYGLEPSSSYPGEERAVLTERQRLLLVAPDFHQLPAARDVLSHLERGGSIALLFSSDQAGDPKVRKWLAELGLSAERRIGLALSEGLAPHLLDRRGSELFRRFGTVSTANSTSLLKAEQSDSLFQTYSIRPTQLPRRSGLLLVSFMAEQFSDDAMGEVWDGVRPSTLGRLRERQIAEVLAGNDLVERFDDDLVTDHARASQGDEAQAFAMFEDGALALSGRVGATASGPLALDPSAQPEVYFAQLRISALEFIQHHCPKSSAVTTCKLRMLGPDMMEWLVSWGSAPSGRVASIELLHERRFSGSAHTINVLFGN